MTTEERLAVANKDSFLPFDDSDAQPNALQSIREVATSAITNYIQMLDNLKQGLKAEAWEAANMNNARFGDAKDYAGKAVNESNYFQAMTGSVWSLECFNLFRERDYVANIDYSKFAWIDGKRGSYVDPTTNKVVVVDIDGSSDFSGNIGIYIRNNADVQNKLNMMKELAFSAGQNDQLEVAIEAIENNNITSIAKNIKKAIQARRDYELQMQQVQQQAQAEVEQIVSQREAAKQEFEAQQNALDRKHDVNLEILKQEGEKEIWNMRLKVDTNGNGNIDKDEAMAAQSGYTASDVNRIKLQKELKQ